MPVLRGIVGHARGCVGGRGLAKGGAKSCGRQHANGGAPRADGGRTSGNGGTHRECAATRAETLRKWAQGLQDARLERGVPNATKVQTWKGATVQGAHLLNINPMGVRAEAVENGVRLWEPFARAGCSGLVTCLEAGFTVKDYI